MINLSEEKVIILEVYLPLISIMCPLSEYFALITRNNAFLVVILHDTVRHGRTAVSTCASQQKGPGLDSWTQRVLSMWTFYVLGLPYL